MDGRGALPDPETQRGKCRDEPERARLQPETGHENNGRRQLATDPDSVNARNFAHLTPPRRLQGFVELSHVLFRGAQRLIMLSARERSTKADARNPFGRFYTLWAESGP